MKFLSNGAKLKWTEEGISNILSIGVLLAWTPIANKKI